MLSTTQKQLAKMMDGSGFVRRFSGDEAFFISDAPRRIRDLALCDLRNALEAEGFLCNLSASGLWEIDLSNKRFQALYTPYFVNCAPAFPKRESDLVLYELARLLEAHPATWEEQPKALLRALAKNAENPAKLRLCAQRLLPICAERLRRHMALPSSGAGVLRFAMERT